MVLKKTSVSFAFDLGRSDDANKEKKKKDRYIPEWGGAARPSYPDPVFKTNIADFPTLFKTEFRFLIPCLRHLMCLVSMPKSTEVNIN